MLYLYIMKCFSLTKVKRNSFFFLRICQCLCCLFSFSSLAHSIFIFVSLFLLRDVCSSMKISTSEFFHADLNHMQFVHFCHAEIHFWLFWLFLPTSHFCLALFLSFFFLEICSVPRCVLLVLSFISFYTLFRSFFAVYERAVLKEYTYITYCIQMNV